MTNGDKSRITIYNMSRILKQQALPLRATDLDVAVPLLEKALDIHLKCLGKLHMDTAFVLSEIGVVLRYFPKDKTNERALAVMFLQEAYAVRKRLCSDVPHHPLLLETLCELNDFLLEEGLWELAKTTSADLLSHRRDMPVGTKVDDYVVGDSADVARSLLQLALVCLRLNELDTARERCTECVDMSVRVFGQDSVETSCALTLLGEVRSSQGKPNKAKAAHEQALEIRKTLHESRNLSVAGGGAAVKKAGTQGILPVSTSIPCWRSFGDYSILHGRDVSISTLLAESYESLAYLRLQNGKVDKTHELYTLALSTRREEAHQQPDVMMSHLMSDTAHVLCMQGRYVEAKPIMLETLRIRRLVCRHELALVAEALMQLASINMSLHEFEEALLLLEEALGIRKDYFSSCSVQVAEVYVNMAMVFSEAGDIPQAHGFLIMALKVHKHRLSLQQSSLTTKTIPASAALDDSEEIAQSYVEIGSLYFRHDDFAAAIPFFEDALSMSLRLGGLENPHVPPVLLKLAFSAKKMGNLTAARQRYEQAIAILTSLHKKANGIHLDVAAAVSSLSSLCFYQGKFEEALEFSKRTLSIRKVLLGPYHEDVMSTLWNQANICDKLGRFKESLGKVMIVYKWRERRLGLSSSEDNDSQSNEDKESREDRKATRSKEDSIRIEVLQAQVQCLVLIAQLLRKTGQLDEALNYNSKAENLLLRIKRRGPAIGGSDKECNDYDVLERDAFAAEVLKMQAHYEDAEARMRDVVRRCIFSYGSKDSQTAAHQYSLATILHKRGHLSEALELFNTALDTQIAILGNSHVAVANTMNNIGVLLVEQDLFDEAEEKFSRALAIRQEVHGAIHADVASTLNNLAGVHDMRSDLENAKRLYQESLQIRVKLFSKHHPAVAQSLNNLAQLQVSAGEYDEAERLFRNTLRILKTCYGPRHPDVAACLNNLAGSLEASSVPSQLDEALALYQEALSIRQEVFGEVHTSTAQSLNNVASIHFRKGDFQEAIKLYNQSIDIKTTLYGAESTDIAETRNNIAMLHMAAGALASAAHCQEEAVGLMERLLGPDNPRTVNVQGNLGVIYRRMGVAKGDTMVAAALLFLRGKHYPDSHPWVRKFAAEQDEQGEEDDKLSLPPPPISGGSSAAISKKPPVQRRPVSLTAQHSFIFSEDDGESPEKGSHEERAQEMLRSLRLSRSLSVGSSENGDNNDEVEAHPSITTPGDTTDSRKQLSTSQRYKRPVIRV